MDEANSLGEHAFDLLCLFFVHFALFGSLNERFFSLFFKLSSVMVSLGLLSMLILFCIHACFPFLQSG